MNEDRDPPTGRLFKFMLVVFSVGGLLSASQEYFDRLADAEKNTSFLYPLIWEGTGYSTAFLMAIPLYLFVRRFPITRATMAWRIPLHVIASFLFCVLDTSVFYVVRLWIYDVFGLGEYHYGVLYYRYIFEFHKFMVFYWAC